MRHGSVWVIKFLRVCGKRGYHYCPGWQMKTWAIPTAYSLNFVSETKITPVSTVGHMVYTVLVDQ